MFLAQEKLSCAYQWDVRVCTYVRVDLGRDFNPHYSQEAIAFGTEGLTSMQTLPSTF